MNKVGGHTIAIAAAILIATALSGAVSAVESAVWQEMRVTNVNSWKSFVSVYGTRIVWADNRNNPGQSIYDIYCYDLAADTEFPLFIHPANQIKPEIYGDRVVFEDYRDQASGGAGTINIYMYDFLSDSVTQISSDDQLQYTPSIYDNNIFWHDLRDFDNAIYDIYRYYLSSSTKFQISAPIDSTKLYARSYANIVVWQDNRNGDNDIYAYDLALEQEFALFVGPSNQLKPDIFGDVVVWEDHRDWIDSGSNIIGYDLVSQEEIPVCTNIGPQSSPSIHGDMVVWQDDRSTAPDIYGASLGSGAEFPICTAAQGQYAPKVFEKLVVFIDWRHGHGEVYCATPLEITSVAFDQTTSTVHLSWRSLPGKQYQVQTGPAPGQFTETFGPVTSAGLSTDWETVIAPSPGALFCRVKLFAD